MLKVRLLNCHQHSHGAFPKWGVAQERWMVYRTENPKLKWMMTGELGVPPKILASDREKRPQQKIEWHVFTKKFTYHKMSID